VGAEPPAITWAAPAAITHGAASFTRIETLDSAQLVGLGMAAPGASYPALYVVGTIEGVYGILRSDDAGASWTRINDDAHQYGLLGAITGDPRIYGRVYMGTEGRGHRLRGYCSGRQFTACAGGTACAPARPAIPPKLTRIL